MKDPLKMDNSHIWSRRVYIYGSNIFNLFLGYVIISVLLVTGIISLIGY